jgi:hypothetical protein
VMTPLVAADLSARGGRFNLRLGILGAVVGLAAAASNMAGGLIATDFGAQTAFTALALAGVCAVMTVAFVMPETRPAEEAVLGGPPIRPSTPQPRAVLGVSAPTHDALSASG